MALGGMPPVKKHPAVDTSSNSRDEDKERKDKEAEEKKKKEAAGDGGKPKAEGKKLVGGFNPLMGMKMQSPDERKKKEAEEAKARAEKDAASGGGSETPAESSDGKSEEERKAERLRKIAGMGVGFNPMSPRSAQAKPGFESDEVKAERLKKEKEECMRPVKIRITGSDKLESLTTVDITEYEDNDNDNDTYLEDEEVGSEDENDLQEHCPLTTEEAKFTSSSSSDEGHSSSSSRDIPTNSAGDKHRILVPSLTPSPANPSPNYTWNSAALPFGTAPASSFSSSFSGPFALSSRTGRSQMSIGALVQPSVEHHPTQRFYSEFQSAFTGSANEDLEVAATLNLLRSGTS